MGIRAEVARSNLIFTAGNVSAAILGFVFSIVIAQMLQPEQFGLFSFAIVVMGFFTAFIDLGISSTFVKFVSACMENGEKSKVRSLVSMFVKLRVVLTLAAGIAMVVFSEAIATSLFNKPGQGIYVMLAAGLLASNSVVEFANMVLLSFKRFGYIVGLRVLERVLRIVFAVSLVALGFKAAGAAFGVAIGFVLVGIAGWAVILGKHRDIFRAAGTRFSSGKLIGFGFWAMLGAVVSSLYVMTDVILISALRPIEEVGFYNIALSWMTLVTYVVPISSVVMYPYFSRFGAWKNFAALQNSIKYALVVALPLAFLMSAFSEDIIMFFYSGPFMLAAPSLGVLSLVSVTLVINPLLMGYFYGIGRPRIHTTVTWAVFAINIALCYVMIGLFGIWGAAAAMLASRLFEFSVLVSFIRVSIRMKFRWGNFVKPFVASVIIYVIASRLPVQSVVHLVFYGLALLAAYAAIMLAMGGVDKQDVRAVLGWARRSIPG